VPGAYAAEVQTGAVGALQHTVSAPDVFVITLARDGACQLAETPDAIVRKATALEGVGVEKSHHQVKCLFAIGGGSDGASDLVSDGEREVGCCARSGAIIAVEGGDCCDRIGGRLQERLPVPEATHGHQFEEPSLSGGLGSATGKSAENVSRESERGRCVGAGCRMDGHESALWRCSGDVSGMNERQGHELELFGRSAGYDEWVGMSVQKSAV
jgi:hypothetical protein